VKYIFVEAKISSKMKVTIENQIFLFTQKGFGRVKKIFIPSVYLVRADIFWIRKYNQNRRQIVLKSNFPVILVACFFERSNSGRRKLMSLDFLLLCVERDIRSHIIFFCVVDKLSCEWIFIFYYEFVFVSSLQE